jgi:hypothetical protein
MGTEMRIAAFDASPDKISSGHELQNLENRRALLSAPTRNLVDTQSQGQPLGALR